MHAIAVCLTSTEFDEFIKSHLDQNDSERFADCEWVPVKITVTDTFGIEVIAVPAK